MLVILQIMIISIIAYICDKLWQVEERSGKIFLAFVTTTVFVGTISFANTSDKNEIDQAVPWIAACSVTLLLKWLCNEMQKEK